MITQRVKILTAAVFAVSCVGTGFVAPAAVASPSVYVAVAAHACTRTASHKCIRGGQLCAKAKYNKSGYDAKGRRYVCKGSRTHPHWEKP